MSNPGLPAWGRALWGILAFTTLLRAMPQVRELQVTACAAGLAWFAFPLFMGGPATRVHIATLGLQALFGALWAAASWAAARTRDRVWASTLGGLAVLLSVGVHVLGTWLRLGR